MTEELMLNTTQSATSSNIDNYQLYDNDSCLVRYRNLYRNYHGLTSSIVCMFGLTCNLFNIIVLTRPLMRSSISTILTSVAVSDLLKMLFVLPAAIIFYCLPKDELKSEPDPTSYFQVTFYMIYMLVTLTLHCISTWLTVFLATFRYIFLSYKTLTAHITSAGRALICVGIIVVLSTILCIPTYIELHIVKVDLKDTDSNNSKIIVTYRYEETSLSKSLSLRSTVFVLHSVMFKLIPCILLLLFSFLLIQQLRHALKKSQVLYQYPSTSLTTYSRMRSRKREKENRRTTLMLVIVCVLFLITELPQGVILLLTFLFKNNSRYYYTIYQELGDTFDILALINNSVNFMLYCLMSHTFRDTFKKIFSTYLIHRSILRFRLVKRQQNRFDQSLSYQTVSPNRNHQMLIQPIQRSSSDNQNRKNETHY